jgi:hypothetical protein
MPAALAFIVIPAKAGIQRRANPAGTTRGLKCITGSHVESVNRRTRRGFFLGSGA